MRLRLTLLIAFIGLALIPKQSKAQLYKQWGFWLTDTTLVNYNYVAQHTGIACDKNNNIYIQHTKPENGYDTISVTRINKDGTKAWSKDFYNNDTSGFVYPTDAKLYFWENRLISITPFSETNVAYFFLFNELDKENGNIIKSWKLEVPLAIERRVSFINTNDGNIYFCEDVSDFSTIGLIKFDLNNNSSHGAHYPGYQNLVFQSIPNITNVNDSLITITGILGPASSNSYGFQCFVVRKSDLGIFNSFHESRQAYPWSMHGKNDRIYLIGRDFYEYDIYGNQHHHTTNFNTHSANKDQDFNFYCNNSFSDEVHLKKVKPTGEVIWEYIEENENVDITHYTREALIKDKVVLNSLKNRYIGDIIIGVPHYETYGIKSTELSKNGDSLGEFTQVFDSTRGRLNTFISTQDNEGNPIILSSFYFIEKNNSNPNANRNTTALYLYKLCANCDTTTPPPLPSPPPFEFTNYLKVLQNPISKNLNYNFGLVTPGRMRIIINDVSGKVVYKKTNNYKKGAYTETINLSHLGLQPGSYFLNMITDYKKYSKQFILSN